jgi:putative solute:sodium symporter small subunit
MEKTPESYHISFFKPTTQRARANRNMVLWLVSVWFIAIFGFQILLRIIEKPVPEPSFISYESAWMNIETGQQSPVDLQELAKSCLSVAGKLGLDPGEEAAIDNAFSWCVYRLVDSSEQARLEMDIRTFENLSGSIETISDKEYIAFKKELSGQLSPILGLADLDVRKTIIPFALTSAGLETLGEASKEMLPRVMKKYLIHNRSVLTDIRFLGFPFHYFYTAVFLLILFVGLCLIYCIRTDAMNKRLEIPE